VDGGWQTGDLANSFIGLRWGWIQ